MPYVNKVILIGNLGADPETRYLPSGDAVSNCRIATTEKYKDKTSGEVKEITEWHRIAFFGKLAEIVEKYVTKGSSIYIEGRLRTRKWTDQAGVDKYSTEIIADSMQMLGGKREGGNESGAPRGERPARENRPAGQSKPAGGGFDEMDDDIPF